MLVSILVGACGVSLSVILIWRSSLVAQLFGHKHAGWIIKQVLSFPCIFGSLDVRNCFSSLSVCWWGSITILLFRVHIIRTFATVTRYSISILSILCKTWRRKIHTRLCQMLDGPKNRSNTTTHLHWKIIPTWLHLKKEVDLRIPEKSSTCWKNWWRKQSNPSCTVMINNSRDLMSTTTQLILELDGDFTLQPDQQLRLRHRTGSSTTIGSRIKVGILGDRHPGLNSNFSYFSCSSSRFRLPEISIPWQSTEGVNLTPSHTSL